MHQIPIGCHAVLNSTVSRIQYGSSTFAENQSVAAQVFLPAKEKFDSHGSAIKLLP